MLRKMRNYHFRLCNAIAATAEERTLAAWIAGASSRQQGYTILLLNIAIEQNELLFAAIRIITRIKTIYRMKM
jgi:hypothetical protein